MQAKSLDLPINSIHNLHKLVSHNMSEIEQLLVAHAALMVACENIIYLIENDSENKLNIDKLSLQLGGNLVFGVAEQIRSRMSQSSNERLAAYAGAKAGR